MTGYVEGAMEARIAQAYAIVQAENPECDKEADLELLPAPQGLCELPTFTPRMKFIVRLLRELFATETGREAAVLLRKNRSQCYPIGSRRTVAGDEEYGVDGLGPYRLFRPKKRPLLRRGRSTLNRISLEEAVFCADDPNRVYQVVYLLLTAATTAVLKDGRTSARRS